ncbi:Cytochrome d ubiquinol oxidase subunit I [Thermofilum adornatum 1505]|uniref:Cytochrome d ubiquinol oxidase subunit I n=2 Tax=Thermofilum adornatum TaxID=1365176 RepID=A0A3G1A521_9CREN|nr:cytochrome ubiquinol oxidase subunit I [Thermofilum adornatum]AJB41879.1 Cytochrome d ubiquinol oxidase subunit I [Thermofilum adornatum 1505]
MNLLEQYFSYPAAPERILSIIGIELHWILLQYTLGLPFAILVLLLLYKKTGNQNWLKLARTATKALGINFALGAASGTLVEFGLVVVWPNVLEAAGRYIYYPLYLEIFAFLTEIVFVYLLVFGWNKLSMNAKIIVAFLAMFGAWFSAAMIVSVNSYMVAPTGIVSAYNPQTGWMYSQGYPKVLLVVPSDLVGALDVAKLQSLGMEVVGQMGNGVAVYMPSKIVARLAYEAWSMKTVGDSVLALVVKPEALPAVKGLLVKDVVDKILVETVRTVGYTTVTFQSPVYFGSILHSIGAALTVTGFTSAGAFALLMLLTKKKTAYYMDGLKFGVYFSLVAIVLQGAVFGHTMGEEIAQYNPEKLAAMEGTSNQILSIPRTFGIEGLMKLIIYGNPNAQLPGYDQIPVDYCSLMGVPNIPDCRPPLILHYLYYTKTGLAILLGLLSLAVAVMLWMKKEPGNIWLWSLAASPVIAHLVSFLGWGVREMGRKPWTIYGVMTVDVARTANPVDPLTYAVVGLLFIAVLALQVYAAWRLLFVPSLRGEEE